MDSSAQLRLAETKLHPLLLPPLPSPDPLSKMNRFYSPLLFAVSLSLSLSLSLSRSLSSQRNSIVRECDCEREGSLNAKRLNRRTILWS